MSFPRNLQYLEQKGKRRKASVVVGLKSSVTCSVVSQIGTIFSDNFFSACLEDGCKRFFRNVNTYQPKYRESHPRRPSSSHSLEITWNNACVFSACSPTNYFRFPILSYTTRHASKSVQKNQQENIKVDFTLRKKRQISVHTKKIDQGTEKGIDWKEHIWNLRSISWAKLSRKC